MQRPRARRAALATGLALLMGCTALTPWAQASAQTQPQAAPQPTAPQPAPDSAAAVPAQQGPQTGFAQRILVRGNERIEPATIVSYLPIQAGEQVDPAKIDLALKALFRTDLFADVKIDLEGSDLIVTVVENPIINRVIFEGNRGLKEDKLRDEVTVRPRGIFTRAKVQQDVQRIVELYRRSGRISANVTPQIIELPQKRVDLIFKIDEGPKSGILRVNFLGNKAYSDNDLRDVVRTEQSSWYKFFTNDANYDPDRLEYDREQLRKHYRNRGYYDFRVVSAVAELAPDKNGFVVNYTLDEGVRYRFGKVDVETELQKLDKNVLRALLPIRPGQVYEDQKIEQATDSLTFAAGAAGFAFVDVRPQYTPNRETRTVDVIFNVREGPRVYVDRIDIVGNSSTLDYVIRREMMVSEGDAYNRALVDRSKNNIKGLGFFKDVTIDEVPGSAPDRTGLRVNVEEQATGELSFSAGYSSIDKLVLDLGVSQRNFRGRGQNVRARVSVGSLRQQVEFSFTEPRFRGRDLAAGVDVYQYRYDLTDYSAYKTDTVGAGLRLDFPLTLNMRGSLNYSLSREKVSIDSSYCDPVAPVVSLALCAQRGNYVTSLIGYGFRVDKRNDPINPTRGFTLAFAQDFAGLGGDVKYVSTRVDGGWYHGFSKSFILSVTGEGGYITGWGGDDVRINDRFYKGGNTFRGFELAGLGPRDTNFERSDALGAKAYAIGSVELMIPTGLPEQYGIKAALFTDFGAVGLLDRQDKLNAAGVRDPLIFDDFSLRAAAGLSIFWRSPMGPIQFDFSKVLKKEPYDKTETFRFTQTTRFQ